LSCVVRTRHAPYPLLESPQKTFYTRSTASKWAPAVVDGSVPRVGGHTSHCLQCEPDGSGSGCARERRGLERKSGERDQAPERLYRGAPRRARCERIARPVAIVARFEH